MFVGSIGINNGMDETEPGIQVASVRADRLTFTSERLGVTQDRKPTLSSWEPAAPLAPILWGLRTLDAWAFVVLPL